MSAYEISKDRVEYATERQNFEKAFRLVYQEYLRKGYCLPNPFEMRISLYNALPETVMFCLWRKDQLIGTASLIPDSPMGLPMEEVYPNEVETLRGQGRRLCEISLLALNSEVISKGILPLYFADRLRCLFHLFKPLLWYARKTIGYTDLCIAINPIHKPLYSSLYFEVFGEERVYESVNGNPSLAMRLSFDQLEDRSRMKTPGLHKLFLKNGLELKKISEFFRWNQDDFRYFFTEKSEALRKARPEQIEYLSSLYPSIPIKPMVESKTPASGYGQSPFRKCA